MVFVFAWGGRPVDRTDDLSRRLAGLSPEQRKLLALRMPNRAGVGAIPRQPRTAASYPLSFAQQRLWFYDQWEPGSNLYNTPVAVRLRGALDAGALDAAFAALVRRHEVLRTVFIAQ